MKPIKLGRPSPALVIACISLFVALSGVGYAAATIGSKQIKNNSVASGDIKNSSIVGKDVKNSGLTGSDVKNNSLTGSDITESKLGKVGSAGSADRATTADTATSANSAATAGNANTVGGARVIPFSYRSDSTATPTVLAKVNGMELRGICIGADNDLRIYNLSGGLAEATFNNVTSTANTTVGTKDDNLANNSFINPAGATNDDGVSGQATFYPQNGRSVHVLYTLDEDVFGFDCSESGVVIG